MAIIIPLNKSCTKTNFWVGISSSVWMMRLCTVKMKTVISGAISECLPNEITQTCSQSNKVGLFAEIQPRLFPAETVVCELNPDILSRGGVVLLETFLIFAPERLCSWHCVMLCSCTLQSPFNLSCIKDKRASLHAIM